MALCHVALRPHVSGNRGISGRGGNGNNEGMRTGQIVLDRQIKEGENSYDEDG